MTTSIYIIVSITLGIVGVGIVLFANRNNKSYRRTIKFIAEIVIGLIVGAIAGILGLLVLILVYYIKNKRLKNSEDPFHIKTNGNTFYIKNRKDSLDDN